jgi:hypothetical protein
MFGSAILEVAISIIFVYLLLSLLLTAANELIASLWKWRARTLIPSRTFALALLDIVAKNGTGGVQTLADIRTAINTSQINQGVKDALLVLTDLV